MLVNQIMSLKPMDSSMFFKKLKMYKSDKDYNVIAISSYAYTVDPNKHDNDYTGFLFFLSTYRFALAAKVTRITMIFQCYFCSRIPLI